MQYQKISLGDFPRREQFLYFHGMANPYVGVTAEADIAPLLARCKASGVRVSLAIVYVMGRAANRVPALRQRILDGQPVQFDVCETSHTVLRADGSYGYCRLNPMQPLEVFLPEAERLHGLAKQQASLDDGDDALGLLFLSAIPWVHYTALTQPTPVPADSNPRISWGQFREGLDGCRMPVTLLANHALVDGLHIGQFYAALNDEIAAFSAR